MLRGANIDIGEGRWRLGASFEEFCDTVLTFISPFFGRFKKSIVKPAQIASNDDHKIQHI